MTTSHEFIPPPQTPVEVAEMAFAIALFVAAANGKIASPNTQNSGFWLTRGMGFTSDDLLLGAKAILGEEDEQVSDKVPLARAVSVIWHHYAHDGRQQAICARLVAFYSLTVRSRGALLGPWVDDSNSDPQSVVLAPSIVEAVATASFRENGQFRDTEFKALVRSVSERDGIVQLPTMSVGKKKEETQRTFASPRATEVVQQLSLHLFAFQACVAATHDAEGILRFQVIEQLRRQVAAISGNASLQAMLSRALIANRSNFPWLESVNASDAGIIGGLDQIQPSPTVHGAMECELAVLGSFIELLRSFLGDGVTLQILRSLWRLATLTLPK